MVKVTIKIDVFNNKFGSYCFFLLSGLILTGVVKVVAGEVMEATEVATEVTEAMEVTEVATEVMEATEDGAVKVDMDGADKIKTKMETKKIQNLLLETTLV
jgi:hypothetical protein